MTRRGFENILKVGEYVGVEFKRGGNGAQNDTFEPVCVSRVGPDKGGHWEVVEQA